MIDGGNKIGSLSRMLELVRLSGAKRTERATLQPETRAQRGGSGVPRDIAVLKSRLRRQVADVDLEDESSMLKARRSVLREIFAWEFGDAIRGHSEFAAMVETVETAMAANDGAREKFAAVIADLKGDAKAREPNE